MSENANPESTPPATETPSSSAAPTATWRAGQHSRFAGRSAEEILGIAETLADVATRFNQPIPQQQPQPSRFDLDLPDEEYLTGRQVKGILQQLAQQQPQGDPVAQAQAAGALYLAVKNDPSNRDVFAKWEAEVRQEVSKLPVPYWNLDTLTSIVKIVRSNHVDELAAEKAQRLIDESHPTIRSGSGGGSGSVPNAQLTLQAEGIPAEWKALAAREGIDEAKVREFCELSGITEAQYYADLAKYGKGSMIRG